VTTLIPVIVVFGLLVVGGVLIIYSTIVKNKWGINPDPVSCPRCSAPLPRIRRPQTRRQAVWGGWTCPACRTEVDKWGRQTAPAALPGGSVATGGRFQGASKKTRVAVVAAIYFCLTLLLDWTGVTDGGFPSTWYQALFQVGAAVVETAIFTALFFLVVSYLRGRLVSLEKGGGSAQGQGSNRDADM
jgi:hypothetical protein